MRYLVAKILMGKLDSKRQCNYENINIALLVNIILVAVKRTQLWQRKQKDELIVVGIIFQKAKALVSHPMIECTCVRDLFNGLMREPAGWESWNAED